MLKNKYSKYLNSILHKAPITSDFSDKMRVDPNLLLKETRDILKNNNLSIDDKKILDELENYILMKTETQQDLGF